MATINMVMELNLLAVAEIFSDSFQILPQVVNPQLLLVITLSPLLSNQRLEELLVYYNIKAALANDNVERDEKMSRKKRRKGKK